METRTKVFIVAITFLGTCFYVVYAVAARHTREMDEDERCLAEIQTFERAADEAATASHYDLAVEKLGLALESFKKLHERPVKVDKREAYLRELRYKLAAKAREQETEQAASKIRLAKEDAARKKEEAERQAQEREQAEQDRLAKERLALQEQPRVMRVVKPKTDWATIQVGASQQAKYAAASTQPATFNKYYSLMKNEFIKSENGQVALTPEEVERAIAEIKRQAINEKEAVEQQMLAVTQQIAQAEGVRKGAEAQAREHSIAAKKAGRKTIQNEWGVVNNGGQVQPYSQRRVDSAMVDRQRMSQAQSAMNKAQASSVQGNINAWRAELGNLKKRSTALAGVAAPYNRSVPPKQYWTDLPPVLQEQLARVGISQDEFKGVLKQHSISETDFVRVAFVLDYQEKDNDVAVAKLRALFAEIMEQETGDDSVFTAE